MVKQKIRKSIPGRLFDIVNYFVLTLAALITVSPFVYLTGISLIDPKDYQNYGIIFPRHLCLDNYLIFFNAGSIMLDAYKVTVIVTVVGTLLSVITTAFLAYALTKKDMPGCRQMNFMIFFPMIFGGGLIPWYLVMRFLCLTDNIWSMIIPPMIGTINVFIMRTFFSQIPESIEESAKIDGAKEFTIMFRLIIPLSLPCFATIALFYAVGRWNEWFLPMMLVSDPKLFPLQLALKNIISSNQSVDTALSISASSGLAKDNPPMEIIKAAAIMLTLLPILCVYPFLQKYFVKGVMIGSIKG
jgi:ABC-type sugar transport system, permease component